MSSIEAISEGYSSFSLRQAFSKRHGNDKMNGPKSAFIPTPVETPAAACPRCFCKLDRAISSVPETHEPRPGDVTSCAHCGVILEFTETLGVQHATDETLRKVAGLNGFKVAKAVVNENFMRY